LVFIPQPLARVSFCRDEKFKSNVNYARLKSRRRYNFKGNRTGGTPALQRQNLGLRVIDNRGAVMENSSRRTKSEYCDALLNAEN
jgi:hypothetical protein